MAPRKKKTEEVVEETTATDVVEETTATTSNDEVKSVVKAKPATEEVTKVGIYIGENAVRVFNITTHGEDFKSIAETHAKKLGGTVKPYVEPKPIIDTDVVNVVNGSDSLVRQYSLALHGEEYEELAAAFLEKHDDRGYRLVKPE